MAYTETAAKAGAFGLPLEAGPVRMAPISELSPGESPRSTGVDAEHVRVLAESDEELPPIIVHRETMHVIDGVHRLQAAILAGTREIKVRFFEGDEKGAFVVGVRANTAHGLPLSLADRKAAASRILQTYPEWSDRAIAAVTGLAARTVSGLRRRSSAEDRQLLSRIGLDGRARPVNSAQGRRLAFELLTKRPDASMREIARASGVSPGTVKDVRDRMDRGVDPVPSPRGLTTGQPSPEPPAKDVGALLRGIRRDPSLRFTDVGRFVLRWLDANAGASTEWERLVDELPPHTAGVIAELARVFASDLVEFAARLDQCASPSP